MAEPGPQRLQRLLQDARWKADAVQAELPEFWREEFGDPEKDAVLDATSFVKWGTGSVRVKRRWEPLRPA